MTRRPSRLPERPSHGDMQSCPGKIPFFEERVAKQRAREIREAEDTDMHAYCCSSCGYWHLGHAAGRGTSWRHEDRLFQVPPTRQSVVEPGDMRQLSDLPTDDQ